MAADATTTSETVGAKALAGADGAGGGGAVCGEGANTPSVHEADARPAMRRSVRGAYLAAGPRRAPDLGDGLAGSGPGGATEGCIALLSRRAQAGSTEEPRAAEVADGHTDPKRRGAGERRLVGFGGWAVCARPLPLRTGLAAGMPLSDDEVYCAKGYCKATDAESVAVRASCYADRRLPVEPHAASDAERHVRRGARRGEFIP